MRYLLLLLLTAGCGGAPFSADLLADRDAAESSAPDAPDPDGGLPEADGGGGGQDALAEAGDAQVEAGNPALVACVSYFRGYATGCTCQLAVDASPGPAGPCTSFQWNDAGALDCTRSDLATCSGACGWDGGVVDYGQLCACIYACLGSCAATNALYFECRVGSCTASACP